MAINDPLRPLYGPATWRHCDAAMEQSGSRSWRTTSFNSEDRQCNSPAQLAASMRRQIECLLTSSNDAVFGLVGFWAGVPAVAPASTGRRQNEVEAKHEKAKQEVRCRSDGVELWRTAFARREQKRCSALLAFRLACSRSSGVSRAKAEVKVKHEVRRMLLGGKRLETSGIPILDRLFP
jgi:hypothetical protein